MVRATLHPDPGGPIPVALPHAPGIDVAGTVDALGEGADRVRAGDQVVGFLPMTGAGAAAEYVLAPTGLLTAAPASIPLADAGGLPRWSGSPPGRPCSTTPS